LISAAQVIWKKGSPRSCSFAGKLKPGLPKVPAAEKIDVDENGKITGLF